MHNRYVYHPMHMHIHTCFQPGSSMASHLYNANKLGMQYIWFTDHDVRMGTRQKPVTGFVFDTDSLMKNEGNGLFHGFVLTEYETPASLSYGIDTKNQTLTLTACAEEDSRWQSAGIHFVSSGTRHTASLLRDVCLNMNLSFESLSADARLIFDICLSQRPPKCETAHMCYVAGSSEGLLAPHTQILPLQSTDGALRLDLSQDVSDDLEIGGKDNVFDTVRIVLQVRNGAKMDVVLRNFSIETKKQFEQAHTEQKRYAKAIGKHYGVTPFVSFEISDAGEHKNCFSTHVPVIDYAKKHFCVSNMDAVRHVKSYGGMFAINHPLAINALKRKSFTELERSGIVANMAAELLACRAYGADLIEVGFPCGRNGFSLEEYLRLWDLLSTGGLFLCGYGSSDSHRNNDGWFDGNNFATYIAAEASLPHPIDEAVFARSMRKGMVYTGNPVKLKGEIQFQTEQGVQMGSVLDAAECPHVPICFFAAHTEPLWQFRLIENGKTVYTETLSGGAYSHQSTLYGSERAVCFQRAVLYDENGVCVLVTNPIYLVKTEELACGVPDERLVRRECTT